MPKTSIGDVKTIPFEEVFSSEDKDFTPWLSKHISKLGDKVGMDLEVIETESLVGSSLKRIDILARDKEQSGDENYLVCIENQRGTSNADHLNKCITYAAGIGAKAVIWIAEYFSDEHTRALNWLNEKFDESVFFFGVSVQCIKIGNSDPAVQFNTIVTPNEWSYVVEGDKPKPTRNPLGYQFWKIFYEEASKRDLGLFNNRKPQPESWANKGIGLTGANVQWTFFGNSFCFGLYINTGDGPENDRIFAELKSHQKDMEELAGIGLVFYGEDQKTKYVYTAFKKPATIPDVLNNENLMKEVIDWGLSIHTNLIQIFKKYYPK